MTDIVWVALISAGGAVVAAAASQFLSALAAAKQAERSERLEGLQWSRSQEKRRQDLYDARLKEMWAHVMTSRTQMMDPLASVAKDGFVRQEIPYIPLDAAPATGAGQAYAVALLGIPALRDVTKAFYLASAELQVFRHSNKGIEVFADITRIWLESYKALEDRVATLADGLDSWGRNPLETLTRAS